MRWSSHISIVIPISFNYSIVFSDQYITSKIKLSFIIEKRLFKIFLENKCSSRSFLALFNKFLYFFNFICNSNTISSITIFTWLYKPNIFAFFLRFEMLKFSQKLLVLLIICPIFNVKCKWQIVKYILLYWGIVSPHIIKQAFFVAKIKIFA